LITPRLVDVAEHHPPRRRSVGRLNERDDAMEATALKDLLARFPQAGPPLASVLVQIREPMGGESSHIALDDGLDAACELLPPGWQQQSAPNGEGKQSFGDAPNERWRKGFVSKLYFREFTPSSTGNASVHFRNFVAFQDKVDTIRAHLGQVGATFAALHDAAEARRIEKPGLVASMVPDVLTQLAKFSLENGKPKGDVPHWDKASGRLMFEGRLARKVKSSIAKNIAFILDAFEEMEWPDRIDDPNPKGRDPERMRQALSRLNENLHGLKFLAGGDGSSIQWTKSAQSQ
jgi:hypothetical protein